MERLKASLPSQALAWPCGPLTCTGQCQLCGINLKSAAQPFPRRPRRLRPGFADTHNEGYVRLPDAFGRTLFHRAVWELANNMAVPPHHDIHHIDGVKTHNCPANLQALPCSTHAFLSNQKHPLASFCRQCGVPFRSVWASTAAGVKTFCSPRCAAQYRNHCPPLHFASPESFMLLTISPLTHTTTRPYAQPSFSFF